MRDGLHRIDPKLFEISACRPDGYVGTQRSPDEEMDGTARR